MKTPESETPHTDKVRGVEETADCENGSKIPHPSLTTEDIRYLTGRYWLDSDWIARAGVRKVSDREGRETVGHHPGKRDLSGYVIPNRHPVTGDIRNNTLRRNNPERRQRGDNTIKDEAKYLREPGKNHAYFPPGINPDHLTNTDIPRFIIEGEFKAMALLRLLEAESRPGLVIGLAGAWNYFGRTGKEMAADGGTRVVKGVIPDIAELVKWDGARVVVVYDYDERPETRRDVMRAQWKLIQTLQGYGADVETVTIPQTDEGKCGFDDYILSKGPHSALTLLDSSRPVDLPGYRMTATGIVWKKPGADGVTDKPLTNFTAVITREIRKIDDADNPLFFEIEGAFRDTVKRFILPAADFARMEWHLKELGAGAAIYPDHGARERARFAIQMLSGDVPKDSIYLHTGWTMIDGRRCYLHGRGAIGAHGVTVDLGRMKGYDLPDTGVEPWKLQDAMGAALRFLDIAPRVQTWPVLSAMFLAALSSLIPPDFVLWFHGKTGSMKSTMLALALNFYGDFSRFEFPANFQDTPTSFELKAHALKDAPLVVDDFKPTSNQKEAARQDGLTHHIIRSVGDRHARGRATANIQLRADRFPRGLVMATGESEPPGAESSAARCFLVKWEAGSVNTEALTRAQREDAKLYPIVTAAYIEWLVGHYDRLAVELPDMIRHEADRFDGAQGRIPEAFAKLKAGAECFIRFAVDVGAMTNRQADALRHDAAAALADCARLTVAARQDRTPVRMFFELLQTLFAQGDVYLADAETEDAPTDATEWGWTRKLETGIEVFRTKPLAKLIGWVSEKRVYLLPDAATAEVAQFARKLGETFPTNRKTLGEHLAHENHLTQTDREQGRSTVRIRVGEKLPRVWALTSFTQKQKTLEGGIFCGNSGNSGNRTDNYQYNKQVTDSDFVPGTEKPAGTNETCGNRISDLFPQDKLVPREKTVAGTESKPVTLVDRIVTSFVPAVPAVPAKNIGGGLFFFMHTEDGATEPPKRNRKTYRPKGAGT